MAKIDHSWEDFFVNGDPFQFRGKPFENKDDSGDPTGTVHLLRHGVDIGQAMKTGPLWWRYTGSQEDWQNPSDALTWADRFLPMSDGMYGSLHHNCLMEKLLLTALLHLGTGQMKT